MASLTIRKLDEALKRRLRLRAAHHGHSVEEEIRQILRTVAATDAICVKLTPSVERSMVKPWAV